MKTREVMRKEFDKLCAIVYRDKGIQGPIKAKDLLSASQIFPIRVARHLTSPHPSLMAAVLGEERTLPTAGQFFMFTFGSLTVQPPKRVPYKTYRKP